MNWTEDAEKKNVLTQGILDWRELLQIPSKIKYSATTNNNVQPIQDVIYLLKFFIKQMNTKTISNTGQFGDVVCNLVDGFSLLIQELILEELG